MAPKVSVCIPSFNHAPFIRECVVSVLSQSTQDLEVIVTDDASSDNSMQVLDSFKDRRVRVQRHPKTLGPSAAINSAVQQARGEYVAVLGSDDLFLADKLAEQVAVLEQRREICAVFSFADGIDEQGARIPDDAFPVPAVFRQRNRSRAEWLRRFLLEGNCLCASTAVIRRDVLRRVGDHDPRLLQLQDFDYWIRVCLIGEIHVIQRPLAAYRIRAHQGNLSGDRPQANARAQWEAHKVLRHFLGIADRRFLLEVFPDVESDEAEGLPLPYVVARAALTSQHPGVRLFALDVLFDLLGRESDRAQLEKRDLLPITLSRLAGELDPLNIQTIAELKAELLILERALAKGGWALGEWAGRALTKLKSAVRRWRRRSGYRLK
jgi:glycosyltransferase involved in cell wall biosynthesis